MKKLVFISAVLSCVLFSCKKDYTCECTSSSFGAGVTVSTTAHSTKSGATNWCKSYQSATETVNDTASATFPLTCSIK